MEILQLKNFKVRWFILFAVAIFIGVTVFSVIFPYVPGKEELVTLFIQIGLVVYVLYQSKKHGFIYSEAQLNEQMTGARWAKYLSLATSLQLAAYASGIALLMFVFLKLESQIRDFFFMFLQDEQITELPIIVYVLFFINVCVLAPIWEEIFFRGILLRRFTLKWSPQKSIIISSILFGLIHVNPLNVFFAFFIGCLLGYVYLKTKSIIVPILVHSFSNFLAFLQFCWTNRPTSEFLPTTEAAQMTLRISLITIIVACVIALVMGIKYYKSFKGLKAAEKFVDEEGV